MGLMKKTKQLGWAVLGAAFLLAVSGPMLAAETQKTKKAASTRTPEPAQIAEPPADNTSPITVNAITGVAAKSGVVKCLSRVNQVTNFVTANSESGAYLFVHQGQPDNTFISSSLEVQNGKILTYASASFAPIGDRCGSVYETFTWWPENCETVGTKGFAKLKKVGVVQRHIQILEGAGTMRMFLVPAGTGCISIKKEVIF